MKKTRSTVRFFFEKRFRLRPKRGRSPRIFGACHCAQIDPRMSSSFNVHAALEATMTSRVRTEIDIEATDRMVLQENKRILALKATMSQENMTSSKLTADLSLCHDQLKQLAQEHETNGSLAEETAKKLTAQEQEYVTSVAVPSLFLISMSSASVRQFLSVYV